MKPMAITQYRLAKETEVPARRINEIVHRERAITADTALRLARFFGTSEMFWLNLQARYDLDMQKEKLGTRLQSVRPFASSNVRKRNFLEHMVKTRTACRQTRLFQACGSHFQNTFG